jgi:hypothetical protein
MNNWGMEFRCAGEMQEPHESRSGRKFSYDLVFFFRTDRNLRALLTDVEALRIEY